MFFFASYPLFLHFERCALSLGILVTRFQGVLSTESEPDNRPARPPWQLFSEIKFILSLVEVAQWIERAFPDQEDVGSIPVPVLYWLGRCQYKCDRLRQETWSPRSVAMHVKLSDVSLGTCVRGNPVADENVKKPANQTNNMGGIYGLGNLFKTVKTCALFLRALPPPPPPPLTPSPLSGRGR